MTSNFSSAWFVGEEFILSDDPGKVLGVEGRTVKQRLLAGSSSRLEEDNNVDGSYASYRTILDNQVK